MDVPTICVNKLLAPAMTDCDPESFTLSAKEDTELRLT
jgi:hypothetical protein